MPADHKTAPSTGDRSDGGGARNPAKYQQILDAAIEVIAANGFANSRVSEIAARAGVADGTIYLYFKSKEQILMAALDSAFQSFLERARGELAGIADPRRRLRRLAELHLSSLGSNRNLAVVFQTELRQSAKFLAEFSHRNTVEYFNLIRSIIQEGQQQGILRRDLSDVIAAHCFFGALDEIVTAWILSEREQELAPSAGQVVDLLLAGMEPRPA